MVRSFSRVYNKFDFSGGLEDAHHAVKLDPGNTNAIRMVANSNRAFGRFDLAVKYSLAAIELDPVQPVLYASLGNSYYFLREQEKAADAFRKVLALSPEYTGAHYRLGRVYLEQGEYSEALREMQQSDSSVYRNTGLAMAYHSLGDIELSDIALNTMIQEHAENAAFQVAEVYGFRQENDKAFEWLGHSLNIHDSGLHSILGNPAFQSLVTDPRWEQFLLKLGLAQAWQELPSEQGGPSP
jgi:tetratricopeptide (TPR) repeat protein